VILIRHLQLSIAALLIASAKLAYSETPSPVVRQYSGCYFAGFETRALTPKGTQESWWVKWDADTKLLARALPRNEDSSRGVRSVFVVVQGRLSPAGRYGHLGGHTREIIVSRLISARNPLPEDRCGPSVTVEPGTAGAESLYLHGVFMESEGNAQDAIRIYRRAARSGSGKAAKRLGEIYEKGIPGVSRDYAESVQWYEKAKQLGEAVDTSSMR
jgi:Sel1 repeat-containing protein